ncbi:hypothetical protein E2C01_080443 [Portunus trituberculatus]|uniref:Uncharacterized protein n=1 Tax=Portunus trituberculatus TaxID=210409 RepID=A0A5B7IJR4_PORTR|nr:hypothetical protein [Portunus trituberculatus]
MGAQGGAKGVGGWVRGGAQASPGDPTRATGRGTHHPYFFTGRSGASASRVVYVETVKGCRGLSPAAAGHEGHVFPS